MKYINLFIQQPALPKYRVPLFNKLGKANIAGKQCNLTVVHSTIGKLENCKGDSFKTIEYTPRKITRSFVWDPMQWSLSGRNDADAIIFSWDTSRLSLIPSIIRARLKGIPVLLWGQGKFKKMISLRELKQSLFCWMPFLAGYLAKGLLFYTEGVAKDFSNRRWKGRKIVVVSNGLDLEAIDEARRYWESSRNKLGKFQEKHLLHDNRVLIYIGRFYRENKTEILFNAFAALKRRIPKTKLIMIGRINSYALELRNLASKFRVNDDIIWAGEIYDEMDIAPYMLSSDVFVYPNNVGLSLIHAFAYGLPAVASDVIDMHGPEIEALQPEKTGLVFRYADAEDMADKMVSLLSNENKRRSMGEEARRLVEMKYNIDIMVGNFVQALKSALK